MGTGRPRRAAPYTDVIPSLIQRRRKSTALPGACLALAVAVAATIIGKALPVLGGPVAAVLIGVVLATWLRPAKRWPRVSHGLRLTGGLALQTAVVVLGTQISLSQAWQVGGSALPVMAATLAAAFICAWLFGRWLGIDHDLRILIGVGTAICGGSAIAAVGPAIKAESEEMSVSLGTIFMLNAVALFAFPFIGHSLGMSQEHFGLWAAIAIQDTSSVVGASSAYGAAALTIAATVKLARALWIAPLALALAFAFREKDGKAKIVVPWFIFLFVAAAAVRTFSPSIIQPSMFDALVNLAKAGFAVTLFLIGLSLSLEMLKKVGVRPFLLGTILWIIIASLSLLAVLNFA